VVRPMQLRNSYCTMIAVWLLAAASAARAEPGEAQLAAPDGPSELWQPSTSGDTATGGTAGESLPPPVDSDGDLLVDGIVVAEQPGWYQPMYWFGPLPWDTGIELGVNGSSGTSDSLSIQSGGYIKRESRFSRLDLDATYNRTTSGGTETQNNAQLDVRNDWLLDERSPWTLFASGNVFYDEFQAFNLQTNANSGIGYRIVNRPGLDLIGRFGAGASREFGGPDDDWVPEALFGGEFSRQISSGQKLYAKLDYFPEWEEFGEYRLVADAGWEIELVQPENLSLKVSATDRYDSTPNGAEPHLVNYSVLLLLKL
jgi:putative salt-induced outer membrane protein YdiY